MAGETKQLEGEPDRRESTQNTQAGISGRDSYFATSQKEYAFIAKR